jgi:hypothetical protein
MIAMARRIVKIRVEKNISAVSYYKRRASRERILNR